jgi:hypothetical protein
MGFEKYQVSAQNPKRLAFSFTENFIYAMKTGGKFVFRPHEVNILARLDITVLYTIFSFLKISSFSSKLKDICL